MATGVETLTYAARPRVIFKYLGQLGLMLAIVSLAPLIASLWLGDYAIAWRYAAVIVVIVGLALPTLRLETPAQVQMNEALATAALAFLLSSLLMTFPLMGSGIAFIDAFFESVSGITTTGLSTLGSLDDKPRSFLFARAWMQWYGGLGIVVLSVALLMGQGLAARRLAESAGGESMATTARTHALRMLTTYSVMTLAGLVALMPFLDSGFHVLTYTLAAISTGGFAPLDTSLAELPWSARYVIIAIALCGAIPLPLFYRAWHSGWRTLLADSELQALIAATALVCVLLALFAVANHMAWPTAIAHATITGISAQTTTGFSSVDPAQLDDASRILLVASMLVGGGVGSTAGGIKILRVLILLRLFQLVIRRTAMPSHAVYEPRLDGKPLRNPDLQRAALLILLFAIITLVSWLIFVAVGYAPINALFEVSSALGTVGLSTGIVVPELHWALKLVLCADMLLGRLEIIALLVLLYPPTWFGKRGQPL